MKRYFLISLLISATVAINAQTITTRVKWINPELQSLVTPACGHYIAFSKTETGPLELTPAIIQKRAKTLHSTIYDMSYLGDRVLFEDQSGHAFPENVLLDKFKSLKNPNCNAHTFIGKIYRDSISIIITMNCPTSEEDWDFVQAERTIDYPGGQPAFQQYLQSFITPGMNLLPTSEKEISVFFTILLKKDSLIHDVTLLEPATSSVFTDLMANALKQTKDWTPATMEGRGVNYYENVFIRLTADGKLEADYKKYY